MFTNKTILITGGTGSMGMTLVGRILTGEMGKPKHIIIFSRDEMKQTQMKLIYPDIEYILGDIRDYSTLCPVIKRSHIIINAAALKQVPSCEYFPEQAVLTNCLGASNIVKAISTNYYPIDTVLGISTDKACKPVNVMGMTKSLQERIITAANLTMPTTRFICVRYGNVLGSRGSVIPMFRRQIQTGGPVTITLPQMTRFIMTLDQAVDTIFASIRDAMPGETYIPKVKSTTIHQLAIALIGTKRIEIKQLGIRPGEKIHEILISEEEVTRTIERKNYYVIQSILPEIRSNAPRIHPLEHEYSSSDHVLDFNELINILTQHNMMVDDI